MGLVTWKQEKPALIISLFSASFVVTSKQPVSALFDPPLKASVKQVGFSGHGRHILLLIKHTENKE